MFYISCSDLDQPIGKFNKFFIVSPKTEKLIFLPKSRNPPQKSKMERSSCSELEQSTKKIRKAF